MSENKSSLPNPHDSFFKQIFRVKEHARNFIEAHLDDEFLAILDMDKLERESESYLDEEMQALYSDLVYKVRLKAEPESAVKLVFLFEHKSFSVQFPHFQLLTYMMNIWKQQLTNREPLQGIIPMVVYHGRENWDNRSFEEYFDPSIRGKITPFLPSFQYLITNLQTVDDHDIENTYTDKVLTGSFLLMKHIKALDLRERLEYILGVLQHDQQLESVLRYIIMYINSTTDIDDKFVMEKVKKLSETWGFEEGSVAHKWYNDGKEEGREEGKQEGKQEGKEEGREEGKEEGIINMLKLDFEYALIAQIQNVPIEKVKQIASRLER